MRRLEVGPGAVLLEVDGTGNALALAAFLREVGAPGVEVVPGATTVLVDGLTGPADRARLDAVLARWQPRTGPGEAGEPDDGAVVEVPVRFDGADLAGVAERWGVGPDGVVARLLGLRLRSAFCGFAPGFAYLTGLPADLAVPRRDSPRRRVPAGSVGLAGAHVGIYPTASPGGWQLLGTTDVVLWDADRAPPALLAPGTHVRLVRA